MTDRHAGVRGALLAPLCCGLLALGCGGVASIPLPQVSPTKAAAAAIEQYDEDGDGALSAAEIESCPGLQAAAALYDQDSDERVTSEEIESRIRGWMEAKIAIVSLTCKLTLNGRPLAGAEVKLVPEDYLGGGVTPAIGKTSRRGTAVVSIPESVLPASAKSFRGVNYGTYRVEVTHPDAEIPEAYQGQSILGIEVAPDCGAPYATFDLKS